MGASQSTGTGNGSSGKTLSQHIQEMAPSAGQLAANTPQDLQSLSTGLNQAAAGVTALGRSAATLNTAALGAVQANKGVYAMVQAHVAETQGKVGGGHYKGGYFGGSPGDEPSKALKEYRNSLAAASKDRISRGLARALSRAGIDVNPDASTEEIARTLQSKLPDPRKGKTFAADAKAQEKICRTIADVLNDEFSPGAKRSDKLFDTSLGPVSVCRQVAETTHSLSVGLHTEFLEVYASLTRVLRNLELLDEVLQELHSKIGAQVRAADLPTGADKKIANFEEAYTRTQNERKRQMFTLRNFLSVTLAPAKEELAIAMRDEDEAHEMIKRLDLVPGTGDFADSLAGVVSNLGAVAAVSARVDKALQEVGLGVEQYLSSAGISDLEEILDSKLMSNGEVDADDVGKFLKAAQTLKENFYRRDELDFGAASDASDELDFGAASDASDAEIAGSYEGGRRGGAESTLDKRVEKRKMEKKLIVKEFINKSTRQYDTLLKAVQALGPQLGKTIPLSDKLEYLRNALANLGKVRMGELSLELALLGYYSAAADREKKENFLSGLRVIQDILDDLMGMEMYRGSSQYFAAVRAAIDGLVRTIDFYSNVVAKKFGSGDADADDDEVTGGDSSLSSLPEIARSSYDLERAVNTFLYYYYVAKVRSNLAQTHKELEFYGEKYVDILGDAVAARLRQLEQKKTLALTTASETMKTFIEIEYTCKADFYRALQALDLYMKAFTDGVVAHPDDVADVKRMLDGVSVIGRWFIEDTGDDLAAAFDMMPAWDGRNQVQTTLGEGGHYYEKVIHVDNRSNGLFKAGVPEMAVPSAEGVAVRNQVAKVFDNFQALKNITNAFVRVGDKFGGKELRRMVFMSPSQIYKAFLEYMKCSALSLGVASQAGPAPPAPGGAAPAPPAAFRPPTIRLTDNAGNPSNAPAITPPPPGGAPGDGGTEPTDGVYFGSVLPGLEGNFVVEDRYFTFCVKAMAAKVLTVIGVYDLFERPSPVYELTPTRMIIGGGDYDATPMAIPEASELYFRLPRLVEFYKDLFGWKDLAGQTQISMLPEIEGIFSGIIRLIFNRIQGGAERSGDYSDLEVRQIVREVNAIYENFKGKGKGSAISEALSAFVIEINRRYGVVKRKDWDTLQTLLNEKRRGSGGRLQTNTNYAILPGEGEEYESDRRAPSDRYLGPGAAAGNTPLTSKFEIDGNQWAQWKMLKEFRERLDAKFASVSSEEFMTYSFSTVIRQGELEMHRAEGTAAKIGVAARLIQGSGNLAGIDVGKSFMFHETVVVGLNTLSGIYTLLDAFRQRVIDTDVKKLRDAIKDFAKGNPSNVNHDTITTYLRRQRDRFSEKALDFVYVDNVEYHLAGGAPEGADTSTLYDALERTVREMRDAWRMGGPATLISDAVAELFATHSVDTKGLMRDLLVVITGLTTTFQGLVTARFPRTASGQIHLDFSGIRDLIQGLMNDVRYFLDLFRPHIAKSVIAKYENRENPGSLYWLEEKLLDGLVSGRPDDMSHDVNVRIKTLEWVSRTVNRTYVELVGYQRYNLRELKVGLAMGTDTIVINERNDGGATPLSATRFSYHYSQYGNLLCERVFYDSAHPNSGIAAAPGMLRSGLDVLISETKPLAPAALYPGAAPRATFPITGVVTADGNPIRAAARIRIWNDIEGEGENDRSMVFSFNQLLAKYLHVFYDSASGRIYRNLVDGFANGSFSRAVMTPGNTLPDMVVPLAPTTRDILESSFGTRGDPKGISGVLFQSLGLILRRLVTDVNPSTQISDHLVATLSEIPLYIRESYRANLPAFIKLFEMVQQEGAFYKQLLAQTDIQVARYHNPYVAASIVYGRIVGKEAVIVTTRNAELTKLNPRGYAEGAFANSITPLSECPLFSEDVKKMLVEVIDAVATGCYSISNAAAEVLRELADEPLYLETQENSIQEYKARYGKMPLMPLSSALTFLKDVGGNGVDTRLFPIHRAGDQTFKFMYGTRKILYGQTSKFSLADAPGVRANLDAFNSSASGREKIDVARLEAFLTNAVSGLRFLVDIRFYRNILEPHYWHGDILRTNLTGPGTGIILDPADQANAAYSVRSTPQETLAVTESSYQDQEMKKISDVVGGAVATLGKEDRSREWIFNIIDMNIIPINIHALMRDIPLAPLYNYVFTFEQMACLMLGETVSRIEAANIDQSIPPNPGADPPEGGGVRNTRQMMLKLMLEPYARVHINSYGLMDQYAYTQSNALVQRIFRGDDSLMMGRPKFLSDQIYNKVLFGSLIPALDLWDEAGPPAAGRMAVGRRYSAEARRARRGDPRPTPGRVRRGWVPMWNNEFENPRDLSEFRARLPDHPLRTGGPKRVAKIYGALTFIDNKPNALGQVQIANNVIPRLKALDAVGKARFDTRIVRTLFFITNIQRLMRLKLNQELTQYRNVLVSNHSIVNPGVTEYGYLPPSSTSNPRLPEYDGPGNETAGDRRYDNETSLVD